MAQESKQGASALVRKSASLFNTCTPILGGKGACCMLQNYNFFKMGDKMVAAILIQI